MQRSNVFNDYKANDNAVRNLVGQNQRNSITNTSRLSNLFEMPISKSKTVKHPPENQFPKIIEFNKHNYTKDKDVYANSKNKESVIESLPII